MQANSMCISCLLSKQEKMIRENSDENKKSQYMNGVLEILYKYGQTESAPWLAEQINELCNRFWGELEDYSSVKHRYNMLLLEQEESIVEQIKRSGDCIRECIKYVCAGNYIDFSAVENVNEKTCAHLLEKAKDTMISEEEYEQFVTDLESAERLVYLTDNCGEIVLDKVFIRFLKELYPNLQLTVIVRGKDVINDATMKDAEEVGLTEFVRCIGNGSGAPGSVVKCFGEEAKQVLEEADVVISKGQGNFESLLGEGYNPYYLFLCKCELFVRRFGLKQYESIFMKEERMNVRSIVER